MSVPEGLHEQMRERTLARLWREVVPRLRWLECADGRRLRVLYPGRPAAGGGPDFREAVLLGADGELVRGDVELHLRPSGWRQHGHHQDPRYNGTVLHVVLWPDPATLQGDEGTCLEAGVTIPVASLFPVLQRLRQSARPRKWPRILGEGVRGDPFLQERVPPPSPPKETSDFRWLDRAGDSRFLSKTRRWAKRLRAARLDQALYEGIMEALGYHQNRAPFLALARGLPYALLRLSAGPVSREGRVALLEALLVGAAGLLGTDQGAGERWAGLDIRPVLGPVAWTLFGCRPDNHPRRRLLGMARLLDRHWDQGLGPCLTQAVMTGEVAVLTKALTVDARGANGESPTRSPALIGVQRAGEVAVNAVLPLCAAWGRLTGHEGLTLRARELYRSWPPLASNHLLRESATLFGLGREASRLSARRQQGLLHLYRRQLGLPA